MENTTGFTDSMDVSVEEMSKLHNAIMERDEDSGQSTGLIKVCIEQLHNVTEETINDVKDEDCELIREMDLVNVFIDMYTRDILGQKWYLAITFDTPFSQEKKEFMDLVQTYMELCQTKATEQELGIDSPIPMFSITMIPYSLNGEYYAHFAFPEKVEMIQDENGNERVAVLTFDFDNMDYAKNELSEDERSEIEASVLRDIEDREMYGESKFGSIYEE